MPELVPCSSATPQKFIELAQEMTKSEALMDNVGAPGSNGYCNYLLLYSPERTETYPHPVFLSLKLHISSGTSLGTDKFALRLLYA